MNFSIVELFTIWYTVLCKEMTVMDNCIIAPLKEIEPVKDIIKRIQQASDIQLNEFILAVIRRFTELNPGQEGVFVSLSTDPRIREEEIKNMLQLLRSCYNQPESQ